MTKKNFIKALEKFPDDMEIVITDGHAARCYHGDFEIKKFKYTDEIETIDIGIGGMRFYDELNIKKKK